MAVILVLLSGIFATLTAAAAVLAGGSVWVAVALYLGIGAGMPATLLVGAWLRCQLGRGYGRPDSQAASSASKV